MLVSLFINVEKLNPSPLLLFPCISHKPHYNNIQSILEESQREYHTDSTAVMSIAHRHTVETTKVSRLPVFVDLSTQAVSLTAFSQFFFTPPLTENLKKYDLLTHFTDRLESRDASASKNCAGIWDIVSLFIRCCCEIIDENNCQRLIE